MSYYRFVGASLLGLLAVPAIVQPVYAALTADQVANIAKSVTVRIQISPITNQNGSGVLVGVDGEVYTVLTVYHVFEDRDRSQIKIVTPDGERYSLVPNSIRRLGRFDLAVVQFRSRIRYSVADVISSQGLTLGKTVYVAGFPLPTTTITRPALNFIPGMVNTIPDRPEKEGYQIFYSNPTLNGMSGGAVLNEDGKLVGIHGQAESLEGTEDTRTGRNGAIPSALFMSLLNNISVPVTPTPRPPTPQPRIVPPSGNNTGSNRTAESFFDSGLAKYNKGDKRGAINDYTESIRLKHPELHLPYLGRGLAKLELGDKQGAINDYNEAIRLKPDYADAYYNRGNVYQQLGQNQRALSDFRQAARIDQKYGRTDGYRDALNRIRQLGG